MTEPHETGPSFEDIAVGESCPDFDLAKATAQLDFLRESAPNLVGVGAVARRLGINFDNGNTGTEKPDETDPLAWQDQGGCYDLPDPGIMFPGSGGEVVAAKKVCEPCPVQKICLEYALANGKDDGVWGGASARERAEMRRQHS